MTLCPPVRPVTPVQGNICPLCKAKMDRGSKIVYFNLPNCECTFPVPNAKTWFDAKRKRPVVAYSYAQLQLDLDFLEQYEQLTCSVALANGLIGGFEMKRQEQRIARMRQKCKGMAMAARSCNADRDNDRGIRK